MTSAIHRATRPEVLKIVEKLDPHQHNLKAWQSGLSAASEVWVGTIDGELACILGLIPPTILSDCAYLWMFHTEAVKGHEFIFVRYSQRMVEHFLKSYSTIVGHTTVTETRSIRWLKWLGAEYGPQEGDLVPFVIKARADG